MRLLIITQKADQKDSVLGFFHRWIEEFARVCDSVIVVAQSAGEHRLPANVRVLSLGKENGATTGAQVRRAYRILWDFRGDYDLVLVHMTPVWITLTVPLLFVLRKPRYLWYEVRRGGWILRSALLFVKKVFCATSAGLPFPSRKAVVVGHGIDTEQFSPSESPRNTGLICAAGRITPVKHYDAIIRALRSLPGCTLDIAGGTVTPSDAEELVRLQKLTEELSLSGRVTIKARPHAEVRDLLRQSILSLHACGGGLDKVVLEAMSCGCLIVSSSASAALVLPPECQATEETLGEKAKVLLALPDIQKSALTQTLRQTVVEHHSLPALIRKLVSEMQPG